MERNIAMIHGNTTSLSRAPSIALQLWYSAKKPRDAEPQSTKVTELYLSEGSELTPPSEQDPMLFVLVIAACEREFNQSPEYEETSEYEDKCLEILEWLNKHGDIKNLKVC